MRHGTLLLLLGTAQVVLGIMYGWPGLMLIWSGISFCIVGVAYLLQRPGMLGKCADGSLALPNVLLLLPFLLFTWSVWHLQTALTGERPSDEVLPGVWIGRRATMAHLPADSALVIDLTAEFAEYKSVRRGLPYLCTPIMDGSAPSLDELCNTVQAILSSKTPVYVHCALEHGRSGTVLSAVMIAKGMAGSPDEAIEAVRRKRPGVRLNPDQRALLEQFAKTASTEGVLFGRHAWCVRPVRHG